MNEHDHDTMQEAGHFDRRTYLVGFAGSAVLTALPFWIVMTEQIVSAGWAATVLIALAVAQILVHSRCFLHVNAKAQGGWALVAFVFTGALVVITISGSLWIMYHLNTNMMPGMMIGTPGGM